MKKALSLLLAGALSVGLLAGCGQTAPTSTASTGASTSGAAEANKTIDTLRKFTDEETAYDPRFTFQQER